MRHVRLPFAIALLGCSLGCGAPRECPAGDDAGAPPDAAADAPPLPLDLFVDPIEVDFDLVCYGPNATRDVVIANASTERVEVTAEIVGVNATELEIADTSCGAGLDAGTVCTITVVPVPRSEEGTRLEATLRVVAAGQSFEVPLRASIAFCDWAFVTPTSVSFGDVRVGERTAPVTITAFNHADSVSLPITSVVVGGLDGTQYELARDGCLGHTMIPGESCEVDVVYAPTSTGTHMGALQITGYDTGTAALQGRASEP